MAKDRFGYGTKDNQNDYLSKFKRGEYEVNDPIDLQQWRKTPWDMDKDIPYIRQALVSIFQGYHQDEKPWYVPGHSWSGKRDELLKKITEAALEKEGFPKDMSLRDFGITNEMLGQSSKEGK